MVKFGDLLSGYERFMVKLIWNGKVVYEEDKDSYLEMLITYNDKQVEEWTCRVIDVHHVILDVRGEL